MSFERVVIVGASLAGLRTAEALRRGGFEGTLTLLGEEPHLPYTRPPLSKQLLAGEWEADRVLLRSEEKLTELDLDLRRRCRATGLDTDAKRVLTDSGEVAYDALVVATGARPRHLPGTEGLDGVHVLRTLDDSLAIRGELVDGARVVVVGAGFIGCEVAAVARGLGLDVTVVEPMPVPMLRGLGPALGEVAADLHRAHGVDVRCGVGVTSIEGGGRAERVVLGDGQVLPADAVIVGIGVVPATDWLDGSSLTLRDGVVCDETLAAVGVEDVWAAGDAARWHHVAYGEAVRFEHWTVAADHGQAVADAILMAPDRPEPHAPVPYVWSDQYDTKIQIVGRVGADDEIEYTRGSPADGRFVAILHRDGTVNGAVGFSSMRQVMSLMMRMGDGPVTVDEAAALTA